MIYQGEYTSIYCKILSFFFFFGISENFPNKMLKEKTQKRKTFQQGTQTEQALKGSFLKGFNNHPRLRPLCASPLCKLGLWQTNEFSLGNSLFETINSNSYISRLIEKSDLTLTKVKSKHLKNKQECIKANRPVCRNANKQLQQREKGKGKWGQKCSNWI